VAAGRLFLLPFLSPAYRQIFLSKIFEKIKTFYFCYHHILKKPIYLQKENNNKGADDGGHNDRTKKAE